MRVGDRHDDARRRLEQRMPEGRPVILPHSYIRRLLDNKPNVLIVSRRIVAGDTHEIHDAQTIRKNGQKRRDGHPERQDDPLVFTIQITDVTETTLGDVDLVQARSGGYKTTQDLLDDWAARRHELDLSITVHLCTFQIVEEFYLHRLVHRGYTTDPAHAVRDEPGALSLDQLEELVDANRRRYERDHREELERREARSLANQLREAQRHAQLNGVDITPEIQDIKTKLGQIRNKLDTAA